MPWDGLWGKALVPSDASMSAVLGLPEALQPVFLGTPGSIKTEVDPRRAAMPPGMPAGQQC